MKRKSAIFAALALPFFSPVALVSCQEQQADGGESQKEEPAEKEVPEKEAETAKLVVALENYVKIDKQDEFEAFLTEFRTTVEGLIEEGELTEAEETAFEDFRVLKAAVARNGAAVYTFLMDPWYEDVNYSMENYFTRALGEEEAKKKVAEFSGMLLGPQKSFQFVEY